MLRHIFYALLGGYFVAGLLIGLNWLIPVDSEPTIQQAEYVPAPAQSTRTQGAESADVNEFILGQALTLQRKSSDNGDASLSPPQVVVLQPPQPDRRTPGGLGNDTGTLGLGRPQSQGPQSLQAGPVDSRSLPTVRDMDQASIPKPQTDQTGSISSPQTLEAVQVDTAALPTAMALSRAQQGLRLLEARRKPAELVNPSVSRTSLGWSADPAPAKLGNEIDGKSSVDSASIPNTIREVFTLACSLLRPAFAAGKLSAGQGTEIGRMQSDYLKKAECLAAAKRATRIAKRKLGCRCTAEAKELDAAVQALPAPAADYKLLMEWRSRSRYFPRSKPRVE
jgi:hypothetical protein